MVIRPVATIHFKAIPSNREMKTQHPLVNDTAPELERVVQPFNPSPLSNNPAILSRGLTDRRAGRPGVRGLREPVGYVPRPGPGGSNPLSSETRCFKGVGEIEILTRERYERSRKRSAFATGGRIDQSRAALTATPTIFPPSVRQKKFTLPPLPKRFA